jgi:hypothetical protein
VQEASGATQASFASTSAEAYLGVILQTHLRSPSAPVANRTRFVSAVQNGTRALESADGSGVAVIALLATALLLCPATPADKRAYLMLLVPLGMEVRVPRAACMQRKPGTGGAHALPHCMHAELRMHAECSSCRSGGRGGAASVRWPSGSLPCERGDAWRECARGSTPRHPPRRSRGRAAPRSPQCRR